MQNKFVILMEKAECDFNISVELIKGDNSYWVPTPPEEVLELDSLGIVDIGDDQNDFEKLVSLIHEIGHVIRHNDNNLKSKNWHTLFEESLAWYLGYDYSIKCGIEINLDEYKERVEKALKLYVKEMK